MAFGQITLIIVFCLALGGLLASCINDDEIRTGFGAFCGLVLFTCFIIFVCRAMLLP